MARPEPWLRTNRRALLAGATVPGLLLGIGLLLAWAAPVGGNWQLLRYLGWAMIALGGPLLGVLLYFLGQPRLAYADEHLLVYLRSPGPVRVPIDVVECFFLGQAPSRLPQPVGEGVKTATVVVRLAEAAKELREVPVKRSLGRWADGYITIDGTWCEPLHADLIRKLNARLVDVKRQLRHRRVEVDR
jgi:hypothetical protein